jgi:hypothetical protein
MAESNFKLRYIFLGFGVFLLVSLISFRMGVDALLEAELDSLREQGHPASLKELDELYHNQSGTVNGADVVIEASRYLKEYKFPSDKELDELDKFRGALTDDFLILNGGLDSNTVKLFGKFLEDNSKCLDVIKGVKEADYNIYPIDWTKGFRTRLLHLSYVRDICELLYAQAIYQIENGELSKAIETIELIIATAKTRENDFVLFGFSVKAEGEKYAYRAAEYLINNSRTSRDEVIKLLDILTEIENGKVIERAHTGELVRFIEDAKEHSYYLSYKEPRFYINKIGVALCIDKVNVLKFIEIYKKAIPLIREPCLANLRKWQEIEKGVFAMNHDIYFYTQYAWSNSFCYQKYLKVKAENHLAVCGLAVKLYELDHNRWPGSLDELVGEYLDDLPMDPFSDKPLKYVNKDGVVEVYSVGRDLVDDGGSASRYIRRKRFIPFKGDMFFIINSE